MIRACLRVFVVLLVGSLISACARPVGDFGRVKPSFTHDVVLPAIGKLRGQAAKAPVSHFNQTDAEVLMYDVVWRFLTAPHAHDWFHDIVAEMQRTRLFPAQDTRFKTSRYYSYLRRQHFASSKGRYIKLAQDIETDSASMPRSFDAICDVIEVDQQRAIAARELSANDPAMQKQMLGRRGENQMQIDWFVRAARYRYDSYTVALERLLVETPHEEARVVDADLSELAILVEQAERKDFCTDASGKDEMMSTVRLVDRMERPEIIYQK